MLYTLLGVVKIMGDMADYYMDLALDAEWELERRAKDVYRFYEDGTLTWKTKDGNKLLISEMSDTHIVNSINMLIKKDKYLDQYTEAIVKILRRELKSRK